MSLTAEIGKDFGIEKCHSSFPKRADGDSSGNIAGDVVGCVGSYPGSGLKPVDGLGHAF